VDRRFTFHDLNAQPGQLFKVVMQGEGRFPERKDPQTGLQVSANGGRRRPPAHGVPGQEKMAAFSSGGIYKTRYYGGRRGQNHSGAVFNRHAGMPKQDVLGAATHINGQDSFLHIHRGMPLAKSKSHIRNVFAMHRTLFCFSSGADSPASLFLLPGRIIVRYLSFLRHNSVEISSGNERILDSRDALGNLKIR
jgi:hypothetical protein